MLWKPGQFDWVGSWNELHHSILDAGKDGTNSQPDTQTSLLSFSQTKQMGCQPSLLPPPHHHPAVITFQTALPFVDFFSFVNLFPIRFFQISPTEHGSGLRLEGGVGGWELE